MKLNERLKLARTQHHYTQQDIADILHISRTTVSSWEVGRTVPSLDFIVDLSNLYELSLDILLKEDLTMLKQVRKDLKAKKIYQRIVLGIGTIIGLFLLLNIIWLLSIKNHYNYITNNWTIDQDYYTYKQDNVKMISSKLDMTDLFTKRYLKKDTIWIMGILENESEPFLSVTFRNDKAFASVPTSSNNSLTSEVRIDSNIYFIEDSVDNPDIVSMPYSGAFPENIARIDDFLEKNRAELKALYDRTEQQYNLVNNKPEETHIDTSPSDKPQTYANKQAEHR